MAQFKFSDQLLASESYTAMYEKLFDILTKTENESCREVIISNFRDFDELKQDDAVKRLMTMYEDKLELLTPFIETFTEMCISDSTMLRVSSLVQYLLANNCDTKLYPGIVKYLLYYSKSPAEVIDEIRRNLEWNNASTSVKLKVIQLLEKSIRRQEVKIADLWIKAVLNLEKSEDLKPLDFVVLLTILSVKEEKLAAIKKIVSFITNILTLI